LVVAVGVEDLVEDELNVALRGFVLQRHGAAHQHRLRLPAQRAARQVRNALHCKAGGGEKGNGKGSGCAKKEKGSTPRANGRNATKEKNDRGEKWR
jgi:hypothetical protein